MKKLVFLIATALLAGCGGGPTSSISLPSKSTANATARQTLSFIIPAPTKAKGTAPASAVRKPLYVSPDTAGFAIYFDGITLFPNAKLTPGTVNSSASIPGSGSTASYTITQTAATNQVGTYDTVAVSFNVLPGPHTIGVVLTAADGFVLSEDQESYTLNPGLNSATMFLRGVADSAFWCDASCDGNVGTPVNNIYTLAVYATDHEGDVIAYQTDSANTPIPFDNGPVTAIEADASGIVSLNGGGNVVFTNPGNAFNVNASEAAGSSIREGWSITIQCVKVGTTTVALQVGPRSAGGVSGFDYAARITATAAGPSNTGNAPLTPVYTTPNQLIGSIPVQDYFGNELQVSCNSSLNLSVQ